MWCLASGVLRFGHLFLLVVEPRVSVLKSAQCQFESDWGRTRSSSSSEAVDLAEAAAHGGKPLLVFDS
jgi:hypothetical protein